MSQVIKCLANLGLKKRLAKEGAYRAKRWIRDSIRIKWNLASLSFRLRSRCLRTDTAWCCISSCPQLACQDSAHLLDQHWRSLGQLPSLQVELSRPGDIEDSEGQHQRKLRSPLFTTNKSSKIPPIAHHNHGRIKFVETFQEIKLTVKVPNKKS